MAPSPTRSSESPPATSARHWWSGIKPCSSGETRATAFSACRTGPVPRIEGITGIEGLVAVVASACGRYLAFSGAPPGNRQPYQALWIVDLETAKVSKISADGLMAFFWIPDGRGLVVVTRGRGPTQGLWSLQPVEGGDAQPLASFYPSLDQKFFLHYFEQFAVSHAPVSEPWVACLCLASRPRRKGERHDATHLYGEPRRGHAARGRDGSRRLRCLLTLASTSSGSAVQRRPAGSRRR